MTNNKVIAIFEDNKFIQMERYEDNLKVGSRKMLPPEYFASMASNLTPGALMSTYRSQSFNISLWFYEIITK